MFWALFGLGNSADTELNGFKNKLTETFGTVLYGIYHFVTIIIVINMLIANMAQSFETILVRHYYVFKSSKA